MILMYTLYQKNSINISARSHMFLVFHCRCQIINSWNRRWNFNLRIMTQKSLVSLVNPYWYCYSILNIKTNKQKSTLRVRDARKIISKLFQYSNSLRFRAYLSYFNFFVWFALFDFVSFASSQTGCSLHG